MSSASLRSSQFDDAHRTTPSSQWSALICTLLSRKRVDRHRAASMSASQAGMQRCATQVLRVRSARLISRLCSRDPMDETRRSACGRDRTQRTRSACGRCRHRRHHSAAHPDEHTRSRIRHHARERRALRSPVGRRGLPATRSDHRRHLARRRRRSSTGEPAPVVAGRRCSQSADGGAHCAELPAVALRYGDSRASICGSAVA